MENKSKEIFVFGSNLAGIHCGGSALEAVRKHGALYKQGIGHQGDSYAIPTKDENIETLPLEEISKYVDDFLVFARFHVDWTFNVVAIGCGLAGYKVEDIAPMFASASLNCNLPKEFDDYLANEQFSHCGTCS